MIRHVLEPLAGALLVSFGAWCASPPLGYLALATFLFTEAWLYAGKTTPAPDGGEGR